MKDFTPRFSTLSFSVRPHLTVLFKVGMRGYEVYVPRLICPKISFIRDKRAVSFLSSSSFSHRIKV